MPRKKQATRCEFVQGTRRCPFDGDGKPRLCAAHRQALQQAARPRPPATILLDQVFNFLQGKPINQDAALGAAEDLMARWTGMGADYHPPIVGDNTEDRVHRRAQSGTDYQRFWADFWAKAGGRPGRPGHGQPPPPPPPDQALAEARRAARIVMGFQPDERALDLDTVKRRHRELVRKHHPDRGRTPKQVADLTRKMAAINNANDVLIAELEER